MMEENKKRRIIIGIVIVILLLCYGTIAVYSALTFQSINKKEAESMSSVLATGVCGAVESELSKPITIAQTMSNDSFLIGALEKEAEISEQEMISMMSEYLSEIMEGIDTDSAFVVSNESKRYYSYDGLNKIVDPENDEHDIWYTIFLDGRKKYDLDVDRDEVNADNWTVFVNSRIEDEEGNLLGVCGVGVTITELQAILQEYEDAYGVKVNLVNEEGVVQVDTSSINVENAYLYDLQYGTRQDGYTYFGEDGTCVVTRYVDALNWYLVVQNPQSRIMDSYLGLFIVYLVAFVVTLALFVIVIKVLHPVPAKKSTVEQSKL